MHQTESYPFVSNSVVDDLLNAVCTTSSMLGALVHINHQMLIKLPGNLCYTTTNYLEGVGVGVGWIEPVPLDGATVRLASALKRMCPSPQKKAGFSS